MIKNKFKDLNINWTVSVEDMIYLLNHNAYCVDMHTPIPSEKQRETTYNFSFLVHHYTETNNQEKLKAFNNIFNEYFGRIEAYKMNNKNQKVQIGYTFYPDLPDYLDYFIKEKAMELKMELNIAKEPEKIQQAIEILSK